MPKVNSIGLRVLTYNLWHGLNPEGQLLFEELEPQSRRQRRFQQQDQVIFKEAFPHTRGFDVAFLQEVSPLPKRLKSWLSQDFLRGQGQMDSAGLKLFGLGPPFNLKSGLVTLTHRDWSARKLKSLQLSGRASISSWASLQLEESRWALAHEMLHPQWGRVLLINVHLHHGLQWDHEVEAALEDWVQGYKISPHDRARVFALLRAGSQRRLKEVQRLLRFVAEAESAYGLVILGGDFNSTLNTEEFSRLLEAGFVEAWSQWGRGGQGLSFDPGANRANHQLLQHFHPSWLKELEEMKREQGASRAQAERAGGALEALEALLGQLESRPRRIDALLVKNRHPRFKPSPQSSVRLIGVEPTLGLMPSDHFGLALELVAE